MTASVLLDGETIRDAFRQWDEGQQPIDAELSESLAALSAFQAHLDAWQQELARERDELRADRERLGHDQSSAEQDQTRLAELTAEADASREKIDELTVLLASRTEELLVLESALVPGPTTREEPTQVEHRSVERPSEKQATDNPVLASVMEQFGKLRQQRALDRPALKKGR